MMTDPKVLLPCPFCGGGVEIDKVDEEHCRNVKIYSAVHCAECGQWFFKGMSEEKAIAAWNRRAVHPHLAQRVLKLDKEVEVALGRINELAAVAEAGDRELTPAQKMEQLEAELARLQVALEATIAEKEKYKRALKIACEVNSDMFATSEEAMIYCIRQAKEASK